MSGDELLLRDMSRIGVEDATHGYDVGRIARISISNTPNNKQCIPSQQDQKSP